MNIISSKIPNGFRVHWTAEIELDQELWIKCEQIKKDASLKLMELAREACERKLILLNCDINHHERLVSIEQKAATDDFEQNERTRIQTIKNKKLKRIMQQCAETFKEIQVSADGNCFYRCMSLYILGSEDSHDQVRNEIVNHMLDNRDKFECYVDGDYTRHDNLMVTVLQRMYQEGRIYRQLIEEEWIRKLGTKAPHGCNIKLNI